MSTKRSATVPSELPRALLHPRHWGTWLGVGAFWLFSRLPMKLRHRAAAPLGGLAWKYNHKRRGIVLKNLELCFPDWNESQRQRIAREHFTVMARALLDIGQVWFAPDEKIRRLTRLEGWEHVEAARRDGKNIIYNVGHFAALDFGAMAIGQQEASMGPYNAAKNPVVDWLIARGRRRFGNTVFERSDGMMAYSRALKRGKALFTLYDEDHGPDVSVFAPFFAEPKATLPMIGRLAKLTNSVVLPLMTRFDAEQQRYVTTIFPPIDNFPAKDAVENATKMNQSLEKMILLAPEEYMWTLRLFKTRPDGGRVYDY